MNTLDWNVSLPTLDKLQASVPDDLDVQTVASEWFKTFAKNAESGNVDGLLELFVEDGIWRDILALTWDFRTFIGVPKIKKCLNDRLSVSQPNSFKLTESSVMLQQPYPDLVWIMGMFTFETKIGIASGIFRLVPTANGPWKAHAMFTNLEDLKDFPENIGPLRNQEPNHGEWAEKRQTEAAFENSMPDVLIVGGGQSGLGVAARLNSLGVTNLVLEKNDRIGDNWRKRYEALCLHDPVWYDHMPYLPFPPNWPVFTPAKKLANWLESYAESMEINVWTSATVTSARQEKDTKKWNVHVRMNNGKEHDFKVSHVVFALGIGGSSPNMPVIDGMDKFKGQILHASQHKNALDHAGKKVVVVGSCTSAHDICADYVKHGIDVTMYQRSPTYVMSTKKGVAMLFAGVYCEGGPPTDVADRLNASFPNALKKPLDQRLVKLIAEADKDTLEGLEKRGFKLGYGIDGSGFALLAWSKAGGYYLDVGASQLIIDGKIKLKNDSPIKEFVENGIKFENGTELPADVVVFATGWADARGPMRQICGDEIADTCGRIWGLDDEGELCGAWRDLGSPGLWYMMGNLALCRFHSKHVALQIKAMQENIFSGRYEKSKEQ